MAVVPVIHPVYNAGENHNFPIKVCNNTGATVRNVTVVFDAFPSTITFDSLIKDTGSYVTLSRTWTIPQLLSEECQTAYLVATVDDLTTNSAITGTITGAENGDYPGDGETDISILIVPEGGGDGVVTSYENSMLVSVNSTTPVAVGTEDSGVLFLADTTAADITYNLPSVDDFAGNTNRIFRFRNADGANDLIIHPDGLEEINGTNADVTLTAGQSIELISKNTAPLKGWHQLT